MIFVRIIVAAAAITGMVSVLFSVLRTVVLPRGAPARLARLTFLAVRTALLLRLRLLRSRADHKTRDHVFALQAPLGIFAELYVWAVLTLACFAALFWASEGSGLSTTAIAKAVELSGSSMLTLGLDHPSNFVGQLIAFAAAGFGLTLLALVITYLPSLYAAFSRREAGVAKLVIRAGTPPSGVSLLSHSWKLGRFERLEEVWNSWQDWFIELGESHTTFPQLIFFRSPHVDNHWVLGAEAVLDGAALFMTSCDFPRQSRCELCLESGVRSLLFVADFLGVAYQPPEPGAEIVLPYEKFNQAYRDLAELGVPMCGDREAAWEAFCLLRARYEPLIATLGAMTDAPRSDWSSWTDETPRHSPPLLRLSSKSAAVSEH